MKLSKRDVNLILGVLSLLLIVAFIFLVYTPKYKDYQERLQSLEPYHQRLSEGKVAVEKLPKLVETLNKYEEQRVQKNEEVKEFVETDFFATIEELADQSNIDLSSFTTASATVTTPETPVAPATTPSPNTEPKSVTNGTAPTTPTTPTDQTSTPATAPPATPDTGSGFSYKVSVKGEYRALMVFIFELRNLEFPATIKGFNLKYNEGTAKEDGFPLQAEFTISFDAGGGANQ